MAKIDISKIEGYSEMTAEEKLAALEAMELPEPDFTGWVKKDALDKAASEAASYKKQLREKMSAEEEKAEREAEERAALLARVEELEHERTINSYVNSYLAIISYSHEQSGDLLTGAIPKHSIEFTVNNIDGRWNPSNPTGLEKYLSERQKLIVRYGMDVDGTIEWIKAGTFYLSEWSAPSTKRHYLH